MDFDKATEMIDRLTSHERQLINCYTIYTTRPSSYHDNSLNSEKCAIQGSQNVILKFFLEWQGSVVPNEFREKRFLILTQLAFITLSFYIYLTVNLSRASKL